MKNWAKGILLIIILAIAGIFLYFFSKPDPVEETPPVVDTSILGCYVAHLSKDIYVLDLESEENGNILGKIAYNNYQKDSSSGSFVGTFVDNILTGNYSFDSEGMHSDSQLIFKKDGDTFIQGFGPTKIIDGKESFDPITDVKYDINSTFRKTENCLETFKVPDSSFSFNYNPFFQVISGLDFPSPDWNLKMKQTGSLLARIYVPRTYLPGTNFSEAKLTIGKSTDPNAIKECLTDPSGENTKGINTTFSDYPFTKFVFDEAGAGNFYETTSYHGIVNDNCYIVEYTIHSTNVNNYSPDQGIKEFDKNKILNDLESIVQSIKLNTSN